MSTQDIIAYMDHEDNGGKLPAFTWPGGYTIFYVTEHADTLCADCATREIKLWQQGESADPPVAYGAFGATDDYPDDDETCDDCGTVIAAGREESS